MSRYILFLLIPTPIILGIALNASLARQIEDDSFLDTAITLGMDIDSALKIYPSATIEVMTSGCYGSGKALGDGATTRRILRFRDEVSQLELDFAPFRNGGRLVRIDYNRRVDLATIDLPILLEQFTRRYGPHDRILYRRKMEPAGRIVGFEWQTGDNGNLRLVLREDFRSNNDRHLLSIVARIAPVNAQRSRCAWHGAFDASDHD